VLILREVLGYSAAEVADLLETTVASVNSALQRARAATDERLPDPSQQQTLRMLGDEEITAIVDRYVEAWERNDVEAVVSLLTEDAAISMPPLASWFGPRDVMVEFLASFPMNGELRWQMRRTTANAQPALGYYVWDEDAGAFVAFALNVLAFRGDRIKDVTAFVVRGTEGADDERFQRWDDADAVPAQMQRMFLDFGLPETVSA
jgi:RNA polymerase sigma-70 factor (ECF subfamily)